MFLIALLVGLLSATASSVLTLYLATALSARGDGAGSHPLEPSSTLLMLASLVASLGCAAMHSETLRIVILALSVAAIPPSIYMLDMVLTMLSARAQANRTLPTRAHLRSNYFTDTLSANVCSARASMIQTISSPMSYMFTVTHVLLLYFILCPLSTLLRLHQPTLGGRAAYRRAHFILVSPRSRPRPLTSPAFIRTVLTASALIFAITWDLQFPLGAAAPSKIASSLPVIAAVLTLEPYHSHAAAAGQRNLPREPDSDRVVPPFTHHLPPDVPRALLGSSRAPKVRFKEHPKLSLIVDSGASFHIHPNRNDLLNVQPCSTRVLGVGHTAHQCTAMHRRSPHTREDLQRLGEDSVAPKR